MTSSIELELRVEELAVETGVPVDTIRYYQTKGLLHAPERVGRTALYDATHVARLAEIRTLAESGFSLRQIAELSSPSVTPLLEVLAEGDGGLLSGDEVAAAAGVDPQIVDLAVAAELLEPIETPQHGVRFGQDAVAMLQAARQILEAGVPLDELVTLATSHASSITGVVDAAIDLFADHVVPRHEGDPAELTQTFRHLLTQTTTLVARHFQRTLVARSVERLAEAEPTVVAAIVDAHPERMIVTCEWR
jgi:DNA-binding transcriptional MerR regulator